MSLNWKDWIDKAMYPDVVGEIPMETEYDQADYVHRVCTAWDWGIPPRPETLALLSQWRHIFEKFPVPDSPSFMALKAAYGWD